MMRDCPFSLSKQNAKAIRISVYTYTQPTGNDVFLRRNHNIKAKMHQDVQ